MQLSEELARAFTSMGRLVSELHGDLPRPDFLVLVRLANNECARSRELAEAEGLDPSTMSRRLASLGARGLVERTADPDDGRAQILTLTQAGREAVAQERARRVALITDALADWDDADRAELARLLGRLSDTVETQRLARRRTPTDKVTPS